MANGLKENSLHLIKHPICAGMSVRVHAFLYEPSEIIPMAIYLRHLHTVSSIHSQMNAKPLTIFAGK